MLPNHALACLYHTRESCACTYPRAMRSKTPHAGHTPWVERRNSPPILPLPCSCSSQNGDKVTCIKHLLDPSSNRRGLNKLDESYKEVLEGYFKEEETRDLFHSVVGQLITSIEPLTIRSLITLRQHAPYDKRHILVATPSNISRL
jgi:hypothetical protein